MSVLLVKEVKGDMKMPDLPSLAFLTVLFAAPLLLTGQLLLAGEEEQRAPPEARTAGTLSQQVMRAISEIQVLMAPEDDTEEPDYAGAKIKLDELRARRYDRMNDFEKSTLLSFYTNYYLGTEDYRGALNTFEEMLLIEELRLDQRLRTLRSLGQLYAAEEEWQNSIDNFTAWRELSPEEDMTVFKGLSYAHYQQERFADALPYWLDYMKLAVQSGEELERDDYTYLNGLYFTLEDFESALELTKTMIVKFNNQTDWQNFNAIFASLDQEDRRVQALNLAYIAGHIDDEQRYMNLGQSLAGMDIPLSGSKIIEEGLEKEIIEQNQDNLEVAAQMHLIASTFADGLPNALRVAEMSDSGDGWDTVGYIYYVLGDYEEAEEAFEAAIDKGSLSNRADTLMFLARSRLELDDFDGARRAARQASDAGDNSDRTTAQQYLTFIGSTEQRYNIIKQRKAESIEYYRAYPPIVN